MTSTHGCRRIVVAVALAAIIGGSGGCAGEAELRLADYLEELEFDAPLKSAGYATVTIGEFDVPVPVRVNLSEGAKNGWMRVRFELSAETAPEFEQAVLSAYENHRGAMNDAVVTAVRCCSLDELTDPRLAAVKTRLTACARPLLGADRVRQLVLNKIATEPL